MTKAGLFAWLCILACVGALDSLVIIFSLIFMSIYSGTLKKNCVLLFLDNMDFIARDCHVMAHEF